MPERRRQGGRALQYGLLHRAGQGEDGGPRDEQEGHDGRYWVPRQTEKRTSRDVAECQRLAGLQVQTPQSQVAEPAHHALQEICGSDRYAARGQKQIVRLRRYWASNRVK